MRTHDGSTMAATLTHALQLRAGEDIAGSVIDIATALYLQLNLTLPHITLLGP